MKLEELIEYVSEGVMCDLYCSVEEEVVKRKHHREMTLNSNKRHYCQTFVIVLLLLYKLEEGSL